MGEGVREARGRDMTEPAATSTPMPIHAHFAGDFVTLLVVVMSTDTMAEVSAKVAAHVVGKRVARRDAEMVVVHRGVPVPGRATVTEAGIRPFQYVFVDYAE